MNLPKAIEILTIELSAWPHKGTDDWYDAVQLGIEAMQRIVYSRSGGYEVFNHLLPSETDE